jgi:hypothetical protein
MSQFMGKMDFLLQKDKISQIGKYVQVGLSVTIVRENGHFIRMGSWVESSQQHGKEKPWELMPQFGSAKITGRRNFIHYISSYLSEPKCSFLGWTTDKMLQRTFRNVTRMFCGWTLVKASFRPLTKPPRDLRNNLSGNWSYSLLRTGFWCKNMKTTCRHPSKMFS